MRLRLLAILAPVVALACTGAEPTQPARLGGGKPAAAGKHDWPQWRGPDRTHVNRETGLLKAWPGDGPKQAWKVTGMGTGYSTPSIARGVVYLMGNVDRKECVLAVSEESGELVWSKPIGPAGGAGGYDGPRSTPTIDGDHLYALGVKGELVCLKTANGELVWSKNLPKDFGGQVGGWGYCESILIDGSELVCTPGGKNTIVKLKKGDGEVVWKAQVPGNDGAQYSSAIIAEVGGVKQYVQFTSGGVIAVAAEDGKFLWRYSKPRNGTANCSTPIFHDGHVFAASGYGTGGGLAKIETSNGTFSAEEVYFTRNMKNHHGGMVLVDGYLYGSDDPGLLTCIEYKTGKVMWSERTPGKGATSYADGMLYCRDEGSGRVLLVEANPRKFVEKGRLKQPNRTGNPAWPHPVIANGRLYIRDQDVLICYDVKGP